MKKLLLSIITICIISIQAKTQNVNIPDATFKAYLVGKAAINTNADTEIQVSEASAFTGLIHCTGFSISDLTGIEAFTALTQLECSNNSLSSLDITQNTALTLLNCNSNSITSLDVTQNTALIELECYANSITSLDVTQNTVLTRLYCYANSLSSLDITQNTAITQLYCNSNSLTSLNVANGNNTNFTQLTITNNPNLTCVQVDNAAYSTANWTIDAGASFSTNCNGSVAINEQANHINLSIYPNPVFNQLSIINDELSILNIDIIDVMGKTVKSISENTNSIDVSDLTKGTYFIKIQTTEGQVAKRFVKM